jgi:threonine dehydratase
MKTGAIDIPQLATDAHKRIRPFLRQTILDYSLAYSRRSGANVYFKCENLQHTGSFKARGAMNKLLSLSREERERGVVTASTGNHGAAVAFGLRHVGATGIVFVPENAAKSKTSNIEQLGAEVRTFGQDSAKTEVHARQFAAQEGMTYISPYNDPHIIGGQGTISVELVQQLETIDAVFVSLGGGGLISGIAGYLKSQLPQAQVIGCSPENSQVMIQSIKAGEILDLPSLPTLSDGTAGGVEAGSITFPLCRRWVDSYITVTEDEIRNSLRQFMSDQHMLIEGSAAVAIAAFEQVQASYVGKNVVILLCGANIGLSTLKDILGL